MVQLIDLVMLTKLLRMSTDDEHTQNGNELVTVLC